jgi:hypothetical protein
MCVFCNECVSVRGVEWVRGCFALTVGDFFFFFFRFFFFFELFWFFIFFRLHLAAARAVADPMPVPRRCAESRAASAFSSSRRT